MKKCRILLCVIICLAMMFSSLALQAAEQASDQIDEYTIDVTAIGNGDIAIDFTVVGTGIMTKLGAECITAYYLSGSRWTFAGEITSDNTGMCETNQMEFSNTVYFHGTEGTYYKIQVELFAENSNGSDSRFETFYVTA